MKGFLAVARREFAQRRFVFAGALVTATIPFLVPALRGMTGVATAETRVGMAAVLAAFFLLGVAGFLGAAVVPGAIADRRIGFDFARPLSSFAIWAGTLAAIGALALGSALVVWIPSALARGPSLKETFPALGEAGVPWPILAVGVTLLLAALFQVVSLALRSRSVLLALDLFMLFLAFEAGFLAIVRLQWLGMEEPFRRLGPAFGAVALAAVLVASYAAVARGRTAIRPARRIQSLVLWTVLGLGLLGIHVWISWLSTSSPREMASIDAARPSPAGSWAYVNGHARGINADFLCDLESGRSKRLGLAYQPVFSGDGKLAAWLERRGAPWLRGRHEPSLMTLRLDDPWLERRGAPWLRGRHEPSLMTLRLDDPRSEPAEVPIPEPALVRALVLDGTGDRIAIVRSDEISVLSLPGGVPLASVRLALGESWPRGYFATRDLFRLLNVGHPDTGSSRLDLYELDVPSRALTQTASLAGLEGWIFFDVDATGTRLLIRERNRRLSLRDARNGRLLGVLLDEEAASAASRFLSDGRIAVASRTASGSRVRIFSSDAKPGLEIPLPEGERVSLGGEAAPGRLVVGVGEWRDQSLFVADLDSGRLEPFAEHLGPALMTSYFAAANFVPAPGAEATKLFYGSDGSLVFLDPLTGKRRALLGGGAR